MNDRLNDFESGKPGVEIRLGEEEEVSPAMLAAADEVWSKMAEFSMVYYCGESMPEIFEAAFKAMVKASGKKLR